MDNVPCSKPSVYTLQLVGSDIVIFKEVRVDSRHTAERVLVGWLQV